MEEVINGLVSTLFDKEKILYVIYFLVGLLSNITCQITSEDSL